MALAIKDSGCNYDSEGDDDDGNTMLIIPLMVMTILMIFMIIKAQYISFIPSKSTLLTIIF